MNLFFSIILTVISIGMFFMYIDPIYSGTEEEDGIKQLLVLRDDFDSKSSNANKINKKKAELNSKYNLISKENLKKIKKILPDHMNNVKLVVDIQRIGYNSNNIRLSDISLSKDKKDDGDNKGEIKIEENNKGYDSVILNFSFVSDYSSFKKFINDLRKSLRLVDITNISITKIGGNKNNISSIIDNYNFNISLKTYWINKNILK